MQYDVADADASTKRASLEELDASTAGDAASAGDDDDRIRAPEEVLSQTALEALAAANTRCQDDNSDDDYADIDWANFIAITCDQGGSAGLEQGPIASPRPAADLAQEESRPAAPPSLSAHIGASRSKKRKRGRADDDVGAAGELDDSAQPRGDAAVPASASINAADPTEEEPPQIRRRTTRGTQIPNYNSIMREDP
jgi:hypothetical protein